MEPAAGGVPATGQGTPSIFSRRERQLDCRACGRQYDVTHLATGDGVRCLCGQHLHVEAPPARAPRRLRCGSCGAGLREGARSCEYCEAELSFEERLLAGICAGCYARLYRGARFCMECGVAVEAQPFSSLPGDWSCPRCVGRVRARHVESLRLVECTRCAGLWFEPGALERICGDEERESLVRQFLQSAAPSGSVDSPALPGPLYLPCIQCRERMHRRNFGGRSGVVVDTCKDHGLWLDQGELERILEFVRRGGLESARERDAARRRAELARAAERAPFSADLARDLFASAHDDGALRDVVHWLSERRSAWRS